MRGAIAVRRFELEDDLAGWGAAQAFMAQRGARDVATQPFEFLPLLGTTPCLRMQAKPLGTHTALWVWRFLTSEAHCGIFPRQYFLAGSGTKGNAVGASRCLQRGQGRIGIGVGEILTLGVVLRERTVTR